MGYQPVLKERETAPARTVAGVYDGRVVRLLEPVRAENACRVTVLFPGPLEERPAVEEDGLERFIGMWADLTPEEEAVLRGVMEERAALYCR